MKNSSNRLIFIDLARCYAIFLALFSHALITLGFFDQLGADSIYIKQFTRMATPLFVFMFGFMIELVYVRKAEKQKQIVISRLFIRAFQCYIAYALTSLSALLGGYSSIESFISSLVFLSDSRFGNILRAYSVMLILSPFIIECRRTYGIRFLYCTLLILLLFHSQIHLTHSIDFGYFAKPMNILLGIGEVLGGPSVAGSFIFYLLGMLSAAHVNSNQRLQDFYKSICYLLLLHVFFFWMGISDSLTQAWINFSDFTYRKHNALGYYLIGSITSLLIILSFSLLFRQKRQPKYLSWLTPIGTSSLITYTIGNLVLNLFGKHIRDMNMALFLMCFFTTVILITSKIDKLPFYSKASNIMNLKFIQHNYQDKHNHSKQM